MPKAQPTVDFSRIREYAERFQWFDPKTSLHETGFQPPSHAVDIVRLSFSVTFLTEDAVPYKGRAVCIGVNTRARSRRLQFVEDANVCLKGITPDQRRLFKTIRRGEIRQVSDILIVEIDGTRFSAS